VYCFYVEVKFVLSTKTQIKNIEKSSTIFLELDKINSEQSLNYEFLNSFGVIPTKDLKTAKKVERELKPTSSAIQVRLYL